jgi:hypothetical protein
MHEKISYLVKESPVSSTASLQEDARAEEMKMRANSCEQRWVNTVCFYIAELCLMTAYYKSFFTAILILRSQQRRLQAKNQTDVHPLRNVSYIIGPERTLNVTFFPVHANSIDSTNK